MNQITVVCDVCGAKKGEGNKWMQYSIANGSFRVSTLAWPFVRDLPHPMPYEGAFEDGKDACSEQCVIKALNEYMSKR